MLIYFIIFHYWQKILFVSKISKWSTEVNVCTIKANFITYAIKSKFQKTLSSYIIVLFIAYIGGIRWRIKRKQFGYPWRISRRLSNKFIRFFCIIIITWKIKNSIKRRRFLVRELSCINNPWLIHFIFLF